MSLLIDMRDKGWMSDVDLKKLVSVNLSEKNIVCGPPAASMPDVQMVVVASFFNDDVLSYLPNLRLIQKVGAGVDPMLADTNLPESIRIARMGSLAQAQEMAEYCLTEVLAYQRNIRNYQTNQSQKIWKPSPPLKTQGTTIGVLGLGHIGKEIAKELSAFGFHVLGWSRSSKKIEGITSYTGLDGLFSMLSLSDYVIGILPSTKKTDKLINSRVLNHFKKGSVLINIGRGALVVEEDLIEAINSGHLKGATLDVLRKEPMPIAHPFWEHPNIFITPHVSGWNVDDAISDIAFNYNQLINNKPLLHEIERARGY